MSLIRLQNVTKRFAGEPVLEAVDFRVEEGEKVGLIGRNGTGKSTVFRLVMGEMEPDTGVIERMKRARFACLAQLPRMEEGETIYSVAMRSFADLIAMEDGLRDLEHQLTTTPHDEALLQRYAHAQEEFQRRDGYEFRYKADRVLQGLGFAKDEFDLPVTALSGGQRTRLMLALVLLEEADLLLLDEPENHLDLEAREWLERFLSESRRAFVIISHDRRMLNSVVDRVVEVERRTLTEYTGNYEAYLGAKALRTEQQQKAFDRQQELIEKEEKFINRFRYKATKARQVQSRIKRLEKMERVEAPLGDEAVTKFHLGDVVRSGEVVLEGEGLGMAYGDLVLYRDFGVRIERGERIGIVGPNGSGKTTLLRHLAGRLDPAGSPGVLSGAATPGHKVTLGFYDQHHEGLTPGNDILTEIRQHRTDMTPEEVRSFMGRFLFTGEDVFKPINALSGGELSRVSLAKLILSDANVLLLDEPTNHLDIATREVLETALASFQGTLVMVSHDRTLVDKLCTRLILLGGGQARLFLGNYTDYRRSLDGPAPAKRDDDVMRIRETGKPQAAKQQDQRRERDARKAKKQLRELEDDIAALESLIETTEARFTELDPADYEAARELQREYDGYKADLQALYGDWETLAASAGE